MNQKLGKRKRNLINAVGPTAIPVMSKFLKFLKRSDLPRWKDDHTVVISSLDYFERAYREMEKKDPFINDPNEGKVNVVHDPIHQTGSLTREQLRVLDAIGVGVDPNANITGVHVAGNTVTKILFEQHFIFSVAVGDEAKLAPVFKKPPSEYDACLEIPDLKSFCIALHEEGTIDGAPFKEYFSDIVFGRVKYGPINFNASRGEVSDPSPLLKDTSFSDQKEARILFNPKKRHKDRLIVKLPNLQNFFRELPI